MLPYMLPSERTEEATFQQQSLTDIKGGYKHSKFSKKTSPGKPERSCKSFNADRFYPTSVSKSQSPGLVTITSWPSNSITSNLHSSYDAFSICIPLLYNCWHFFAKSLYASTSFSITLLLDPLYLYSITCKYVLTE